MLGHKVVLFLAFWETSILFSTVAAPIHIPINSVKGFPFFTSLPTFLIWVLFDNSHSNCWEMTNPWSIISFASIFSHSVGCLSFLPMVSFTVQKLLRLIKGSHLFIFVFISLASVDSPSLEGQMLKLKLQYFGVIGKDPDAGKDWTQKEKGGQQRMRWLDSITNSMYMNLSKLWETVRDRGAWHAIAHGLQRAGHNFVTEQQQQHLFLLLFL